MELPILVETRNVKKVKTEVRKTLKTNGFLAVVADIGSGKSQMYNYLWRYWEMYPDKYAVYCMKAFKTRTSRITHIMKNMLKTISPDVTPPLATEDKYTLLEQTLRGANKTGKKVIVMIDEAQDLHYQTFLDMKKVHEIGSDIEDSLFSIILFGKHDHKWEKVFGTQELGSRIQRTYMDTISSEEAVSIAEKRFGLTFENETAKIRFSTYLPGARTPLTVRSLVRMFKAVPEFEGLITEEFLARYFGKDKKILLRANHITQAMITKRVESKHPEMRSVKQRVSDNVNNKNQNSENQINQKINEAIGELVQEKLETGSEPGLKQKSS